MPYDPAAHVIQLKDGQFDGPTTSAGVADIVKSALASNASSGIVVHFHGGLVSKGSALETAQDRLYPLYADRSNAYPVFFVWEAGFLEAPGNNLGEILGAIGKEGLFREFMKKAGEWVLKRLPAGVGLKGTAGVAVDERALRKEFDDWFAGRGDVPTQLQFAAGATEDTLVTRTKGVAVDEDELTEQINESIEGDPDFQRAVQAVYNGLLPQGQVAPTTRGVGTTASTTSLISKEAADQLFGHQPGVTKGGLSWISVAKAVVEIVIRAIRRFASGRSHGPYVTIVEEVLRQLYIDKIGRIGWWDRMKGDTADAFKPGTSYGGTAFLTELAAQITAAGATPRITLVGHSTGAVYICNFLKAAAQLAPNLVFDVIFEAPAATHDLLAATAAQHQSRIRNFRQFGMCDDRERADAIVPVVYISSLLYFVSGMLESEPDEPLIGMARYVQNTKVYDPGDFPSVEACRRFYARYLNSLNWAPCSGGNGLASDSHHHGDFDDTDPNTLTSIAYILQHGY
jgi:hypothetical protein